MSAEFRYLKYSTGKIMVSDWIKMRTDLYRNPKVCCMADFLMQADGQLAKYVDQNCQSQMTVTRNVTRNAVVGALLSVWGVIRHQGKRNGDDLVCKRVTVSVLDDIADLPGFGDAMESVGWVVQTDEGIVFTRFFEENNNDPEDSKRKKNAERQARYRERKKAESEGNSNATSNVTRDVTVTHREEKRREEIKDTPIVPNGDGKAFRVTADFCDEIRKAYNELCPGLARSRSLNEKKKRAIAQCCKIKFDAKPDGTPVDPKSITFWQEYFAYASESDFLNGLHDPTPPRTVPFKADFEWLINPNNLGKVIDGRYHESKVRHLNAN